MDQNQITDFQVVKSFTENDELLPHEIVLQIGEMFIKCNKEFLKENSDYFKAMLDGNFVEKEQKLIQIQDIEFKGFYLLLNFIRHGTYYLEDDFLLNVLQVSSILQFTKVQSICLEKLSQRLNIENCLPIWFKCEEYSLEPLNLKAKRMALEEYKDLQNSNSLINLKFHQVIYYLSDSFLNCQKEMDVFQSAQTWWNSNVGDKEEYDTVERNKIMKAFLLCLDFKELKANEIAEIAVQENFKGDQELSRILECCLAVVKKENVEEFTQIEMEFVDKLMHSKDRCAGTVPCFLSPPQSQFPMQGDLKKIKIEENTEPISIICYDHHLENFQHIVDIDKRKFRNDLKGYQIIAYKELILFFGGQILTASTGWNVNVWAYDTNKEKWERLTLLPHKRRHFQTVICDGILYIVGGTGPYRVIQDNILYYNFKKQEWFPQQIPLPSSGRPLKCCNFNEKLLILDSTNKVIYMFNQSTNQFYNIKIKDDNNEFVISTDLTVFAYKNRLYINSGNQRYILETTSAPESMEIVRKIIVPTKIDTDCDQMETVVCGKFAYTLYVSLQAGDFSIQLEEFNLDTEETKVISYGSWEKSAIHLPCFAFFRYETVRNSVYVNDFSNLL